VGGGGGQSGHGVPRASHLHRSTTGRMVALGQGVCEAGPTTRFSGSDTGDTETKRRVNRTGTTALQPWLYTAVPFPSLPLTRLCLTLPTA
jgi:hypothetical protein